MGKSALCVSALCGAFSSFLGFRCYCYELANVLLVKEASLGRMSADHVERIRRVSRLLTEVVSDGKWLALLGELLGCCSSFSPWALDSEGTLTSKWRRVSASAREMSA